MRNSSVMRSGCGSSRMRQGSPGVVPVTRMSMTRRARCWNARAIPRSPRTCRSALSFVATSSCRAASERTASPSTLVAGPFLEEVHHGVDHRQLRQRVRAQGTAPVLTRCTTASIRPSGVAAGARALGKGVTWLTAVDPPAGGGMGDAVEPQRRCDGVGLADDRLGDLRRGFGDVDLGVAEQAPAAAAVQRAAQLVDGVLAVGRWEQVRQVGRRRRRVVVVLHPVQGVPHGLGHRGVDRRLGRQARRQVQRTLLGGLGQPHGPTLERVIR